MGNRRYRTHLKRVFERPQGLLHNDTKGEGIMVYIDHTNVETALFVTFSATTNDPPPQDTEVDALALYCEKLAEAWIYPHDIADANSNSANALEALLVEMVIWKLMSADKWNRARGAQSSLEGATFPAEIPEPTRIRKDLIRLATGTQQWGSVKLIEDG